MSFDEFFVNGDKPYAENLNDSVLLANALEFDVVVTAPTQFSTGKFLDVTSARKCGVCTIRLDESLPSGVSVTGDGKLSFTGEKTVQFYVYPNFNQFGKWKSVSWVCTGTGSNAKIKVDLLTKNGDVIVSDITNGGTLSSNNQLQVLDEIIVQLNSTETVTLEKLSFTYSKRNNINVTEESVRILGYSTTTEMNAAILAAVVDKVTSEEVEEIATQIATTIAETTTHTILQEVFRGKTATVQMQDGKLEVTIFEEEDL